MGAATAAFQFHRRDDKKESMLFIHPFILYEGQRTWAESPLTLFGED